MPLNSGERMELSKGGRSLLQGRGAALNTLETEGQMLQRVMPEVIDQAVEFVLGKIDRRVGTRASGD